MLDSGSLSIINDCRRWSIAGTDTSRMLTRLYNCWSSLTGSAAGPRMFIVKESSDASLDSQHEMLHPRGRFFLLKEVVPKAANS